MSQLWHIIYPQGDRTKLTVSLVWDYERDEYDLASDECFVDQGEAKDLARQLAARYGLRLDEDKFKTPAYLPLDGDAQESDRLLARIRAEIRDYHHALDRREHGGLAQERALNAIQNILGMPWRQGDETARREDRTAPFRPWGD